MFELKENVNIKNLIYEVRGKQVMLDSDLAKLYGCANGTKTINLAVKRNIERFPDNFYFQLTREEYDEIRFKYSRFQFETSKIETRGGRKYIPYAFTEQGVAMLSSVLRTKEAAKVSVNIMNAFVEMRKLISENKDIFKRVVQIENKTDYIESTLKEFDNNFKILFDKFDRKENLKSKLFFDGEIYDAYSLLVDIICKAKKGLIVIDNYVDKITLDILSKKNIDVTVLLITNENKSKITKTDINKFNKEYSSLKIIYTNVFHDRFIILDNKELYHLGSSLKDLGKKVFGISKIEDNDYLTLLLDKIKTE